MAYLLTGSSVRLIESIILTPHSLLHFIIVLAFILALSVINQLSPGLRQLTDWSII